MVTKKTDVNDKGTYLSNPLSDYELHTGWRGKTQVERVISLGKRKKLGTRVRYSVDQGTGPRGTNVYRPLGNGRRHPGIL